MSFNIPRPRRSRKPCWRQQQSRGIRGEHERSAAPQRQSYNQRYFKLHGSLSMATVIGASSES